MFGMLASLLGHGNAGEVEDVGDVGGDAGRGRGQFDSFCFFVSLFWVGVP